MGKESIQVINNQSSTGIVAGETQNQLPALMGKYSRFKDNEILKNLIQENLDYSGYPKSKEEAIKRLESLKKLMQECVNNNAHELARDLVSYIFTNQNTSRKIIQDMSKYLPAEGNLVSSVKSKEYFKQGISMPSFGGLTSEYLITKTNKDFFFNGILNGAKNQEQREYTEGDYYDFALVHLFSLSQIEADLFPEILKKAGLPLLELLPITQKAGKTLSNELHFTSHPIFARNRLPSEISQRLEKIKIVSEDRPGFGEHVDIAGSLFIKFIQNPEIQCVNGVVNALVRLLKSTDQQNSHATITKSGLDQIKYIFRNNLEITFLVLAKLQESPSKNQQQSPPNSKQLPLK